MLFSTILIGAASLLIRPITASPLQQQQQPQQRQQHHRQQHHRQPSLTPRAGAPIPRPIPSNCTISDPLDGANSTTRYKPTPAANSTILYSYFLQPDTVTSTNASALFQHCLQTCYGYGDVGQCRSAYLAYDYPMPPAFGLGGGNPVVACLMWSATLGPDAFERVPGAVAGYDSSTVGVIACPA